MKSMFELLRELPLFRGVTHDKMAQTVGQAKFHFLKYPQGETIITAGSPCQHITFILSGKVRSTIINANGRFGVGQTLTAPDVIAPDFLFGRRTNFPATVVALEPTSILQISKSDYLKILYSDEVFMFNYLNTLSVNAQKAQEGIMSLTTCDIDERIAFWIIALTQPGATDIKLACRRRDLCSVFGVPRSIFVNALDEMKSKGYLDYTNTELLISSRKAMLELLQKNAEDNYDDSTGEVHEMHSHA